MTYVHAVYRSTAYSVNVIPTWQDNYVTLASRHKLCTQNGFSCKNVYLTCL